MRHPTLKGKSCVLLMRCSTDSQVETSIPDQEKLLLAFALEHEMKVVWKQELEGISGSTPGKRDDITSVIERKKRFNDFSVLLVQDSSRLTRAGSDYLGHLKHILREAGIKVIFAASNLPLTAEAAPMESMQAYASEKYVKDFVFASTRGMQTAIETGALPHSFKPAFGIDRLYIGPDKRPRHIIRLLQDGSQAQLDPVTRAEVRRYLGREKKSHYRKQADETVALVPGDDQQVEAVRLMFRRKFADGWGYMRIARELSNLRIPTQSGGTWQKTVVKQILENPIYLGVGLANRETRSIHFERNKAQPKPATPDDAKHCNDEHQPLRRRDRSEWIEQRHPMLELYLDEEVRALAFEWQQAQIARPPQSRSVSPSKDKHLDSPYLLKGILKSLQGGYEMTGRNCGSGKWKKRYYALNRGKNAPQDGSVFSRIIPAQELEAAVTAAVREVLVNIGDLRERMLHAARQELARTEATKVDANGLRREREEINVQMSNFTDRIAVLGNEVVDKKLAVLKARRDDIERSLALAGTPPKYAARDLERHVESLVERFRTLNTSFDSLPPAQLRQLLKLMIGRLEVDLETRQAHLEIAVPSTLVTDASKLALEAVGLKACSEIPPYLEAHGENPLILGKYGCIHRHRGRSSCVSCTRMAA